jgi:predicted Fe-Mo cluster-binding NifX family protein
MNDRIAISIEESSNGKETVAEHFGRCSKFKVCELDDDKTLIKTEIYFNPLVGEHNGACQLPGYVKQFNVRQLSPVEWDKKAVNNFLNYGINVITAPGLHFRMHSIFICKESLVVMKHKHEHHHH